MLLGRDEIEIVNDAWSLHARTVRLPLEYGELSL